MTLVEVDCALRKLRLSVRSKKLMQDKAVTTAIGTLAARWPVRR